MCNLRHNTRAIYHILHKLDQSTTPIIAGHAGCATNTASTNIRLLREAGLVEIVSDKGNKHIYRAIGNPDEVEYAEYEALPAEQYEKSAASMTNRAHSVGRPVGGGIVYNERGFTHYSSDLAIHGDRGTGQRSGIRSYGFSSGEMVA